MKKFNVILYDVNGKKLEQYDVIPYFVSEYKERISVNKRKNSNHDFYKVPTNREELKQFIIDKSRYRFWSRCEYEIVISDWPSLCFTEKIDAHYQIMMNIDIIVDILMEELKLK